MLSEETLNKNYLLFRKKLEQACGMSLDALFDGIGEKIRKATFAISRESGCAYDGSLITVSLRYISVYAFQLNQLLPENVRVDENSLIKICLLQHLSKAVMIRPSTDDWRIRRGMLYDFVESDIAMNGYLKVISLCMKYGIPLTENEIEALSLTERTDDQAKYFPSMMSVIVKMANDMAINVLKKQYQLNTKVKTAETSNDNGKE